MVNIVAKEKVEKLKPGLGQTLYFINGAPTHAQNVEAVAAGAKIRQAESYLPAANPDKLPAEVMGDAIPEILKDFPVAKAPKAAKAKKAPAEKKED